ncbi:hypothetical protein [Desulfobulbus propionicus]
MKRRYLCFFVPLLLLILVSAGAGISMSAEQPAETVPSTAPTPSSPSPTSTPVSTATDKPTSAESATAARSLETTPASPPATPAKEPSPPPANAAAPDYSATLTPKQKSTPKKKTIAIYALQIADCGDLPEVEEFKRTKSRYSKEQILHIQICLMAMGYYRGYLDTIPGPLTIEALGMMQRKKKSLQVPVQLQDDETISSYALTQIDFDDWKTFNDIVDQVQQLQSGDYVGESNAKIEVVIRSAINAMTDQYATYEATILKLVEQDTDNTLTEASFAAFLGAQVSEGVVEELRVLQDTNFSQKSDLINAIKSKLDEIRQPTEAFQQAIFQQIKDMPTGSTPEQYFNRLSTLQVPAETVAQLQAIKGIDYVNEAMLRNALECRVFSLCTPDSQAATPAKNSPYAQYGDRVVAKARKQHLSEHLQPIEWRGWSCGCNLNNPNQTLYGFAPFWRAGGMQQIDFSAFDRIGYFALTFDGKGDIRNFLQWQKKSATFINQAHRYQTKVDLIAYKNNWQNWTRLSDGQRSDFIDNLSTNLTAAVAQPLDNTLINRLKPILSFGKAAIPAMGNGVTLYFENYPQDSTSQRTLQTLIKVLRKKLNAVSPGFRLNLVLPYGDIDQLVALRDDVDLFLLFLPEPTKEKKKALRQQIEDKLTGEQRRDTLRKIVPVLATGGLMTTEANQQQFKDDMIYFQDDFGGAGFWPVPTSADPGAAEIGETLHATFTDEHAQDFFLAKVNAQFPWIATLVGPYRWEIRFTLDLLLLVIGFWALISCMVFEVQALFRRNCFWCIAVILIPLVLQLALFIGDPYWRGRTTEVLLITIAGAGAMALLFFFRKLKRADLP